MARLGYDRYGAQGGDWGASGHHAASASRTPTTCAGIHLNMPVAVPGPGDDRRADRGASRRRSPRSTQLPAAGTRGYSKQQSTRPQTLGYGLVDSPAGQCAWIVEKFWAWTDCDGDPENVARPRRAARQRDALLAARAPARRRPGSTGRASAGRDHASPVDVPVGVLDLPEGDLPRRRGAGPSGASPTSATGTSSTAGGHFAAFEQPEAFVDEVRALLPARALNGESGCSRGAPPRPRCDGRPPRGRRSPARR